MRRERAYLRMLDASAKAQWNVAMILEAKAVEAEKVRAWLLNHVTADVFAEHQDQLKSAMQVHDQLVEVIDGLAKLNSGMTHVLKAALRQVDEMGGGSNGLDNMLGGNFDMGVRPQ
ncbi:restriction endonuclease subunit S [Paenibacillus montanisoli]|uniref:Restriction endonuclease subunit S n=1 Tax=Paenibacillus montanisoli TaxID=2081970 RepID=A0A328UBI5_9BACL|nr:restriction endonuclease subunit S [Paenibacillus montanisoli]RAP77406.1 restriction endonuclease subunit S [Paenibacillus montanisoli]